ncbi:MAG: hypothetical protein CML45_07680 [Rhodobacteraceae bacterium]|nr:hypothetical protein [Paracoccaceae bacterium]|tara:strand:- start:2530 stop:3177 length:648 start_codon:yes stop_codon:yes gene_type:complete
MSWTLSTLKTAIGDYLESSETTFTNNLDNFIKESESRILNLVEITDQRKNVQATGSLSNRFLAMPTDFLAPMSLAVVSSSTYDYLDLKHPSFMREYSPTITSTGKPKYYSLYSQESFSLSPVPDAAYTFELHYLHKPASLTIGSDSGTTVLSNDHPDALLYGALTEGAVFLKESEQTIAMFENRFKEAIARMKNISEGRDTRDEYRYDSLRRRVT